MYCRNIGFFYQNKFHHKWILLLQKNINFIRRFLQQYTNQQLSTITEKLIGWNQSILLFKSQYESILSIAKKYFILWNNWKQIEIQFYCNHVNYQTFISVSNREIFHLNESLKRSISKTRNLEGFASNYIHFHFLI